MSDQPILFSAPMIRALLAGRKTQTRRALKPQPVGEVIQYGFDRVKGSGWTDQEWNSHPLRIWVGDRLWVRETWRSNWGQDSYDESLGRVRTPKDFDPKTSAIEYMADGEHELGGKVYPSIFMPRWASRLTLIVTDVRIQRLQDISEDDAAAEGLWYCADGDAAGFWFAGPDMAEKHVWGEGSVDCYMRLWDHINGDGAWDRNPWVAAYSFTVHHCNIDAMKEPT